jgi:hypothetical protein
VGGMLVCRGLDGRRFAETVHARGHTRPRIPSGDRRLRRRCCDVWL